MKMMLVGTFLSRINQMWATRTHILRFFLPPETAEIGVYLVDIVGWFFVSKKEDAFLDWDGLANISWCIYDGWGVKSCTYDDKYKIGEQN